MPETRSIFGSRGRPQLVMAGDTPEPPETRGQHRAALPTIPYPVRVQHVIRRVLQAASSVEGAEVRAFGSSVNGFGDSSSDVDVVPGLWSTIL